jgi:hypothetical protein
MVRLVITIPRCVASALTFHRYDEDGLPITNAFVVGIAGTLVCLGYGFSMLGLMPGRRLVFWKGFTQRPSICRITLMAFYRPMLPVKFYARLGRFLLWLSCPR